MARPTRAPDWGAVSSGPAAVGAGPGAADSMAFPVGATVGCDAVCGGGIGRVAGGLRCPIIWNQKPAAVNNATIVTNRSPGASESIRRVLGIENGFDRGSIGDSRRGIRRGPGSR